MNGDAGSFTTLGLWEAVVGGELLRDERVMMPGCDGRQQDVAG